MIRRSWLHARIALQLLAEERVGSVIRAAEAEETGREDIAFAEAQRLGRGTR